MGISARPGVGLNVSTSPHSVPRASNKSGGSGAPGRARSGGGTAPSRVDGLCAVGDHRRPRRVRPAKARACRASSTRPVPNHPTACRRAATPPRPAPIAQRASQPNRASPTQVCPHKPLPAPHRGGGGAAAAAARASKALPEGGRGGRSGMGARHVIGRKAYGPCVLGMHTPQTQPVAHVLTTSLGPLQRAPKMHSAGTTLGNPVQ